MEEAGVRAEEERGKASAEKNDASEVFIPASDCVLELLVKEVEEDERRLKTEIETLCLARGGAHLHLRRWMRP